MAKKNRFKVEDAEPLDLRPARDRITMNISGLYQSHAEQPVVVQDSCWRWVESPDEPWSRRVQADKDWKPLLDPNQWVAKPGLIFVQNLVGVGRTVNPTAEELAEEESHILDIMDKDGGMNLLIHPKWTYPICVYDFESLMIRCLAGPAWYRLTIYPK